MFGSFAGICFGRGGDDGLGAYGPLIAYRLQFKVRFPDGDLAFFALITIFEEWQYDCGKFAIFAKPKKRLSNIVEILNKARIFDEQPQSDNVTEGAVALG